MSYLHYQLHPILIYCELQKTSLTNQHSLAQNSKTHNVTLTIKSRFILSIDKAPIWTLPLNGVRKNKSIAAELET